MKSNRIKLNTTDYLMCIFVSSLLAFKDYSNLIIIFSIFMLGWLFINKTSAGKIKKEIGSFFLYKIIFITICMLTSLWAPNSNIMHVCFSMLYRLMICLCVLLYVNNKDKFIKLIEFTIVGSILLCVRMLFVVPIGAWGNSRVGLYLSYDPDNTYGNTGITHVLGVVCSILFVERNIIFSSKVKKNLLIILFSFFSLMSGSKKQFFILIIAFIVLIVFDSKSPKMMVRNIAISIAVLTGVYYLLFNISFLYDVIGYRLESFFSFFNSNKVANLEDLSTVSRLNFLSEAFRVFSNNPIIGVGIDSFKYYNSFQFSWAENNFLELLADVGIVGFVVYYVPHLKIFKSIFKQRKSKDKFFLINCVFFVILLFIDLTMVSYNEIHLQFYLAILFSYIIIAKKSTEVV